MTYPHKDLLVATNYDPEKLPEAVKEDLAEFYTLELSLKKRKEEEPDFDSSTFDQQLNTLSERITKSIQTIIDEEQAAIAQAEEDAKLAQEEADRLKLEAEELEAAEKLKTEAAEKLKAEEATRLAEEEAKLAQEEADKLKLEAERIKTRIGFFRFR